jgi:hypothetical protein
MATTPSLVSLGRIGAAVVVVGMTLPTFASCAGPMGSGVPFKGHELLRNRVPDVEGAFDIDEDLGSLADRAMRDGTNLGTPDSPIGGEGSDATAAPPAPELPRLPQPTGSDRSSRRAGEPLFEGKDGWLHWTYLAAFALALLGLVLPVGAAARLGVGILGFAAVMTFLVGFESRLEGASLRWEAGAYMALVGFLGVVADAIGRRRGA